MFQPWAAGPGSVAAPPAVPADPEVVIRQARARQRRRRRRCLAAAAAVLASAVLAGAAVIGYQAGGRNAPRAARAGVPAPVQRFALPPALVAWFDGNGALRIGDVATLAQRPVAQVAGQPCCQLVTAGRKIWWVGQYRGRDYVQQYDLSAGAVRNVAPGWAVFAAPGGQTVYIAQSSRRLLVLPAARSGQARPLVTPAGWQVVPLPWAAAGGITVSSRARRPAIGIWQPPSGRIQVLGQGHVMATWTRPGGSGGLIAWQPAACPPQHCPVEITSTPSGRTLTVHSPLRYGFLGQGGDMAFSPDGTMLAALVSVGPLTADTASPFVPALVSTAIGTVRLVRHAVLANGELAGWLVWLPGPGRLLAGPAADISRYAGYAIDTRTGAARPFTFFPGSGYPANAATDITYGAVLIPRSAAGPAP